MSKRRSLFLLIAVIAGVAGMYAFKNKDNSVSTEKELNPDVLSEASASKELKKMKLVYSEEVEEVAFLLGFMNEKGIFMKNGLDVEQIATGKATNAVAAGEADVQISGPTGSLAVFLGGGDSRLLANVFNKFNNFGISRFPKERMGEIKKVAIKSFGKEPQIAMIIALKSFGVDTGNIEFFAVPAISARLDMIEKGDIDFMNVQSQKTMLEIGDRVNKYYVIGLSEMQKGPYYSHVSIITNKKTLDNKAEDLKSFVFSIWEALNAVSDTPEEAKNYLQNEYGFSQDVSSQYYDRFKKAFENTQFVPDLVQNRDLSDLIKKEFKIEDSKANVDDFVYADFAMEAVRSDVR